MSNATSESRAQEAAVARPDEPPWWLGFIAFGALLGLLTYPLYCYWAYRRGRRFGALWEPGDEPVSSFGWKVAGWSILAIVLPLIDWYIIPHLPTMSYKHGFRIGAQNGTASARFTSLPAFLGAYAVVLFLFLSANASP